MEEYLNTLNTHLKLPRESQKDVLEELKSHIKKDLTYKEITKIMGNPKKLAEGVNEFKQPNLIDMLFLPSTWIKAFILIAILFGYYALYTLVFNDYSFGGFFRTVTLSIGRAGQPRLAGFVDGLISYGNPLKSIFIFLTGLALVGVVANGFRNFIKNQQQKYVILGVFFFITFLINVYLIWSEVPHLSVLVLVHASVALIYISMSYILGERK